MKTNAELVGLFADKISIQSMEQFSCWTVIDKSIQYRDDCDEYGVEYAFLVCEREGFYLYECQENGEAFYLIGSERNLLTPEAYELWEGDEYEEDED